MDASYICENCGIKVPAAEEEKCPGCGQLANITSQTTSYESSSSDKSASKFDFSRKNFNTDDVSATLLQCEALFNPDVPRSEQLNAAEEVISKITNKILELNSEEHKNQLFAYLSEIYRSTTQWEASYTAALKGVKSITTFFNHQSHNSILDSLLNLERYEEFLKEIELAKNDNFPHFKNFVMNYHIKLENYDEALKVCDDYYDQDFESKQYNRAYILMQANKLEEAESIYNKVIAGGPKSLYFSAAINSLAFSILTPAGRYVEAERVLTRAFCTTNERERINAYSNLAMVAFHFKEYTAAKRYANVAIHHPENAIASESRLTLCKIEFEQLKQIEKIEQSEWQALYESSFSGLLKADFEDTAEFLNIVIESLEKSGQKNRIPEVVENEYKRLTQTPEWLKKITIRKSIELTRVRILSRHYFEKSDYLNLDNLFRFAIDCCAEEYFEYLLDYLKTPFADLELRRSALKSKNIDFLTEWAKFEVESEILHSLAKQSAESILVALAKNPKSPDSVCELILRRNDIDTDFAISERETLSENLIALLANSEFEGVRKLLADRQDLNEADYRKLAIDPAFIVREAVRNNPNCSPEIRALAALGSL